MDVEWKMTVPGSTLLIAAIGNPAFGAILLLAGLINLRGNPYQHHGEQRHFMPRKVGKGPASSVLWQPGCAAIEELTCAKFASVYELKGDMPTRDAFVKQLLSVGEHFNDPGYANATLATLLRWYSSLTQRDGLLFSAKERELLGLQVEDIQADIERPAHLTYPQFRHNLRRRTRPRYEGMTELQLRTLFQDDLMRLDAVHTQQRKDLSRAQKRLKAQAQRALAWQDIFGDIADTPALRQHLHAWLGQDANKAAAELAKAAKPRTEQTYA